MESNAQDLSPAVKPEALSFEPQHFNLQLVYLVLPNFHANFWWDFWAFHVLPIRIFL